MIEQKDRYKVYGWMRTELGLSGNPLQVYAIIYEATKDGGEYFASAAYTAARVGCSQATVYSILKKLTERGILTKRVKHAEGARYCFYRAVRPEIEEAENV